MGLLPDTQNLGLRMRRECRERFPRHQPQRKPLVSDPGMHQGTRVTHVPWCISGSLNCGKRSRHSRRMRNSQFYVSGKRPIGALPLGLLVSSNTMQYTKLWYVQLQLSTPLHFACVTLIIIRWVSLMTSQQSQWWYNFSFGISVVFFTCKNMLFFHCCSQIYLGLCYCCVPAYTLTYRR